MWSIDVSTPGKTKIKASPAFGYYIDGGGVSLIGSVPYSPCFFNIVLAPDIPANMGGSVMMIHNKRLCFVDEKFTIETSPKYVKYIPQMPSANQLLIDITHSQTDTIDMEFYVRFFR